MSSDNDDGISQKLGKCTCNLFSCFGFDIVIHYSFPLYILALLIISIAIEKSFLGFVFYAIYIVILFGSVLLHEFGHAFAAKCMGGTVHKILLWPFGGFAYCAHSTDPLKQLAVSVAGPLTHMPLLVLFWGLWFATKNGDCDSMWKRGDVSDCFMQNLFLEGFRIQVLLCVFNLFIPLYPLDGGVIFLTGLMHFCGQSAEITAKVSIGVSTVLLLTLLGLAFWSLDYLSILLCTWLAYEIFKLYRHLKTGKIDKHPLFVYTSKLLEADAKAAVPMVETDQNAKAGDKNNFQPVEYQQDSWGDAPTSAAAQTNTTTNNDSWGGSGWDENGAYGNNVYE